MAWCTVQFYVRFPRKIIGRTLYTHSDISNHALLNSKYTWTRPKSTKFFFMHLICFVFFVNLQLETSRLCVNYLYTLHPMYMSLKSVQCRKLTRRPNGAKFKTYVGHTGRVIHTYKPLYFSDKPSKIYLSLSNKELRTRCIILPNFSKECYFFTLLHKNAR